MTADQEVLDILRKAYQIEVDGYTFYSMTADRADKPAVQELFGKLAQDEIQHQAFLREILRNYDQKKTAAFPVNFKIPDNTRAFAEKIFTDRFREQAEGAAFEMAALSVGMTLEKNAVAHFSGAARTATAEEVRQFYHFLAEWEQQHLDALQGLHETIRGDFWERGDSSRTEADAGCDLQFRSRLLARRPARQAGLPAAGGSPVRGGLSAGARGDRPAVRRDGPSARRHVRAEEGDGPGITPYR